MSTNEQNTDLKTALRLQEMSVYKPVAPRAEKSESLSTYPERLSALEELSSKIDLCLKKQRQVHFITKEIADIIKKST